MPKGSRINGLYRRSLTIVSREIDNLGILSRQGKLKPDFALDLSRYVKLLKDMQEAEEKAAAKAAVKAKENAQSPDDLINALTDRTAK